MPEEELHNLARIGQLDPVPFSADLLRALIGEWFKAGAKTQ